MNRSEIRDEVRRMIRDTDPDTTRRRWTDTDLNGRIDISHEKIVQLTGILETSITNNITSGTSGYALPDIYLKDLIGYWNDGSSWRPLQKTTKTELNFYDNTWQSATGSELTHYYISHNNLFSVYPTPNFSRSSALRLDILKRPDALSSDSEIPFDNIYEYFPFHDLLAIETARACLADEGKEKEFIIKQGELQTRLAQLRSQNSEQYDGTRIVNIYETPGCRWYPRRSR